MKTFISMLLLLTALLISHPSPALSAEPAAPSVESAVAGCVEIKGPVSVETTVAAPSEEPSGNFFVRNWEALFLGLLGFYDVIARLTPSTKDNSIVNFITKLYNALIPNFKKGGGKL